MRALFVSQLFCANVSDECSRWKVKSCDAGRSEAALMDHGAKRERQSA